MQSHGAAGVALVTTSLTALLSWTSGDSPLTARRRYWNGSIAQARRNTGDSSIGWFPKVLRAYKVALSIFKACKDLKGLELIEQLTRLVAGNDVAVPAALRELLAEIDDETDAATMVSVAEEKMHFSGMEIKDEAVTVLSPESLCSLSYKALILSGFNDGFLPCRDYFDGTKTPLVKQEKMRANDVRLLYL